LQTFPSREKSKEKSWLDLLQTFRLSEKSEENAACEGHAETHKNNFIYILVISKKVVFLQPILKEALQIGLQTVNLM